MHELFAATCDLEPQQRTIILDRECAGDPTLRQEVEAMLDQDAASRAFLDAPALGEPDNGDIRLQAGSPCIDAGHNNAIADADLTGDGIVGLDDFDTLLECWSSSDGPCCVADLDLDGSVGIVDFLNLLGNWG